MCGILCILGSNSTSTTVTSASDKFSAIDTVTSTSTSAESNSNEDSPTITKSFSPNEPVTPARHPFRSRALELQKKLRHRGPDWSGIYCKGKNILCHERLAIVDPESGDQPLFGRKDNSLILAVNGEIYNHKLLTEYHFSKREVENTNGEGFRTKSDCEVLLHLFKKYGANFLNSRNSSSSKESGKESDSGPNIRGMFAFVLLDEKNERYVVARDHSGIIPLYYGYGRDGSMWVASEMKALVDDCVSFHEFPPGVVYDSNNGGEWIRYMERDEEGNPKSSSFFLRDHTNLSLYPPIPKPLYEDKTQSLQSTLKLVRETLIDAVHSHLMSDVPFGVLLSGGLDSSLVASIMSKQSKKRMKESSLENTTSSSLGLFDPRLHSFCIGLEGSPDLAAAKKVAQFLGTVHHAYTFTPQQGIDALSDVIQHVETFDVTTIRASTPMFLMSRKIRATGIKMVLSGEGADEIFGGYLYFHKCPNRSEFHEETLRKVAQLSKYDCLRANKSTMAWSVEARVPFLDREFLEMAFNLDPSLKMCVHDESSEREGYGRKGEKRIEKWLLRKAFDLEGEEAYLPKEVLWRQKEQFSDGVGYSWIDAVQAHAEKIVSDESLLHARFRFPEKTPRTKEAYLYRQLFSKHFGGDRNVSAIGTVAWQDSIACSSETALKWDASFQGRADASGRAVSGVHDDAYDDKRMEKVMGGGNSSSNGTMSTSTVSAVSNSNTNSTKSSNGDKSDFVNKVKKTTTINEGNEPEVKRVKI